MIKFEAKKEVNFKRMVAVIEVFKEQERKDIVWLLQNFNNKSYFSSGEIDNFKKLLSNVYGLINSDGTINQYGEEVLRGEKYLFVPEMGVYELILYNDFIKNELNIIGIEESEDIYSKGETPFNDYLKIQNVEFESWKKNMDKNRKFKVKFLKSKELQHPSVIFKEDLIGTLKIVAEIDDNKVQQTLEIELKNGNYHFKDKNFNVLDFERNAFELLEGWSVEKRGILKKFEDIKNTHIVRTFVMNESFKDIKLYFTNNIEDRDYYEVTISSIPIIPSEIDDALHWSEFLIIEDIKNEDSYFTIEYAINKVIKETLEQSPIIKFYPEVKEITSKKEFKEKLLKNLKNENERLYKRIMAMHDLTL